MKYSFLSMVQAAWRYYTQRVEPWVWMILGYTGLMLATYLLTHLVRLWLGDSE